VRLETLVRKYFYRWLNKTRQRRKRREDEKKGGHDSHWDVTDTMEKANLGICDERGQIGTCPHLPRLHFSVGIYEFPHIWRDITNFLDSPLN